MFKKFLSKVGVVSVAGLSLVLAGCGADNSNAETTEAGDLAIDDQVIATSEQLDAAKSEPGLVLYTGSGEAGERELLEQFIEDTGLDADLIRVVPTRLAERIVSEKGADQLGADVIRIDGWDLVEQLEDAKAFRTYDVPDSIDIPDDAVHSDGLYFTSYNRSYVFAYNDQVVEDELTSWSDFTNGNFGDGEIGVTQVNVAGSTQLLARFHLDALGENWLADVAQTQPRIFDSASPLTDSLARGEIQIGAVPLTVAQVAFEEGAPLSIVAPDDGFPVNEYIVGLADGGDSPETAEIFMNWTLSSAGQKAAVEIGDYPINPEYGAPMAGDTELPPLDDQRIHRYSKDEYLENLDNDVAIWEELFEYTGG